MTYFVVFLTLVLVAICLFLILLVLVQLPKKDAGAGMAFGGGTADALFGAGSGNALTKITKYTAVAFLLLSLVLGWLQGTSGTDNSGSSFTKMVEQKEQQVPVTAPAPQAPKPQATSPAANNLLSIPMTATNAAPAPAATNSAK